MLYRIKSKNKMESFKSGDWRPSEHEVEKLVFGSANSDNNNILDDGVFGEHLVLVKRQLSVDKKRLDLLAIDENANAVVIELKRDFAPLGVDMQALQYLSLIAPYKGREFLKAFHPNPTDEDCFNPIDAFLDEKSIDDINRSSRIILLARRFDPALSSMGVWLANQGVSFKCVAYEPIEIEKSRFINFSVYFDQRSSTDQPRLRFGSPKPREAQYFWHNIGDADSNWWDSLVREKELPAGFEGRIEDRGFRILNGYQTGDTVFAYASTKGCIGYGVIPKDSKYRLIESENRSGYDEALSHRRGIEWKATLKLDDAILSSDVKERYGIFHPYGTSQRIKHGDVKGLKRELENRAGGENTNSPQMEE